MYTPRTLVSNRENEKFFQHQTLGCSHPQYRVNPCACAVEKSPPVGFLAPLKHARITPLLTILPFFLVFTIATTRRRLHHQEIQKAFHPSTPLLYISERTPTARHKEMKAAVPFLALLLAGLLGPAVDATTAATPMADESERSANPAPATGQPGEQKTGAVHLRGSDGKPARVPVISRPMPGAGGKQDITNSGDAELGEVVAVSIRRNFPFGVNYMSI